MPNIENINRAIEVLQAEEFAGQPFTFTMEKWLRVKPDCGTAACLGGLAEAFLGHTDLHSKGNAEAFYGLDTSTANDLFFMWEVQPTEFGFPDWADQDAVMTLPTPAAGIRVLEILRDTGKVDWTRALLETGCRAPDPDLDWDADPA